MSRRLTPTSTHWGNYRIEVDNNRVVAVHPYQSDSEPCPCLLYTSDAADD